MQGLSKLASRYSSLSLLSPCDGNKQERQSFLNALRQLMIEKRMSPLIPHGEVVERFTAEILDEANDEVVVITTEWRVSIKP